VPAAAVIPAPAAYTDVAAVKKLVVDGRAEDDAGHRVLCTHAVPYASKACRRNGELRFALGFSFLFLRLLHFAASFAIHGCGSAATILLEWWVVACTRTQHVLGAACRSCVSRSSSTVVGTAWWMSVVVTVNKTVCSKQAGKSSEKAGTS